MSDKPMTLRERIESYVESLGGEMDGFELTQDGLRAVLDAVLTETVIADTERDEYAEIGRLLDSMLLTGKHGGCPICKLYLCDECTKRHEGESHAEAAGMEGKDDES